MCLDVISKKIAILLIKTQFLLLGKRLLFFGVVELLIFYKEGGLLALELLKNDRSFRLERRSIIHTVSRYFIVAFFIGVMKSAKDFNNSPGSF